MLVAGTLLGTKRVLADAVENCRYAFLLDAFFDEGRLAEWLTIVSSRAHSLHLPPLPRFAREAMKAAAASQWRGARRGVDGAPAACAARAAWTTHRRRQRHRGERECNWRVRPATSTACGTWHTCRGERECNYAAGAGRRRTTPALRRRARPGAAAHDGRALLMDYALGACRRAHVARRARGCVLPRRRKPQGAARSPFFFLVYCVGVGARVGLRRRLRRGRAGPRRAVEALLAGRGRSGPRRAAFTARAALQPATSPSSRRSLQPPPHSPPRCCCASCAPPRAPRRLRRATRCSSRSCSGAAPQRSDSTSSRKCGSHFSRFAYR